MTRRRLVPAASLAALLLIPVGGATLAPAPAVATGGDSIVYLKDGRVWIARADGSGARAFTTGTYNWSSPSEDEHGNVVVLGGLSRTKPDGSDSSGSSEIYRFSSDGNQIGKPIPTSGSYSTPSCPAYGPTSARVSPDGTKVAYGIWECGASSYTALWTPITSTGLNFPNQTFGQLDYSDPQWVDNAQFVVSHVGPPVTDTQARWFTHPTAGGDYTGSGWYDPQVAGTGAQAVINRAGTTFAVFADDAADYIDGRPRNVDLYLYSAPDLATAENNGWTLDCTVPLPAADNSNPFRLSPSISTDGTKVYWGDDKGVEVAQIADRSGNCANVDPVLLIPGGSQPFVSSGGLQPSAPEPVQPGAQYPPHARFRVITAHPQAGRAVTFDASASYESLGEIVAYAWRFGDGHADRDKVVKHSYSKSGTYRVRLTVTDRRGVKGSVSQAVEVARH